MVMNVYETLFCPHTACHLLFIRPLVRAHARLAIVYSGRYCAIDYSDWAVPSETERGGGLRDRERQTLFNACTLHTRYSISLGVRLVDGHSTI